jgi:hypothetical protein
MLDCAAEAKSPVNQSSVSDQNAAPEHGLGRSPRQPTTLRSDNSLPIFLQSPTACDRSESW